MAIDEVLATAHLRGQVTARGPRRSCQRPRRVIGRIVPQQDGFSKVALAAASRGIGSPPRDPAEVAVHRGAGRHGARRRHRVASRKPPIEQRLRHIDWVPSMVARELLSFAAN